MTTPVTPAEPVMNAAKVAAAVAGVVTAAGAAFVLIGWATTDQVQAWSVAAGGIVSAVGALLAVVMPLVTAWGARAQVTPWPLPGPTPTPPLPAPAGSEEHGRHEAAEQLTPGATAPGHTKMED